MQDIGETINKKYMADKSQNEPENTVIDTAIVNISPIEPIFDRKKLLEISASCIDEIHNRVGGDRFRVREGDKERIAYLKLLKDYMSLHTSLLAASGAPQFAGVPAMPVVCVPREPTPEEIEEHRLADKALSLSLRNWTRGLAGLPDLTLDDVKDEV